MDWVADASIHTFIPWVPRVCEGWCHQRDKNLGQRNSILIRVCRFAALASLKNRVKELGSFHFHKLQRDYSQPTEAVDKLIFLLVTSAPALIPLLQHLPFHIPKAFPPSSGEKVQIKSFYILLPFILSRKTSPCSIGPAAESGLFCYIQVVPAGETNMLGGEFFNEKS